MRRLRIRNVKAWLILTTGVVAIFAGVWQIPVVREFFGQASGTPADIVVGTESILGEMPRPWRNLAQGGEAFDYRFEPVSGKVAALNPEYIRIDHIYDFYEVVRRENGQLVFDFSKLDLVINDITRMGAKPFIALSYMPPDLGGGDITGQPDNWSEWQLLVQRTVEHVSGRGGLNIDGVYYEVWNEPDLFGGWKTYGDKNYLTLYRYSEAGATAARNVNEFKIGGPAITAYYPAWVDGLLSYVDENNLRFDFFSWHRYNRSIEQFRDDVDKLDVAMEKYPRLLLGTEKIISEWGHDSENDVGYDGNYAAAHTVSMVSELGKLVDKAFIFEVQDGRDPEGKEYWGRWGLLTHNDFGAKPKPRYRAIAMLEQLGNERLALSGEGSFVRALAAKNTAGVTQVLLSNYDPNGRHFEQVPVTFAQIEPGNFVIRQQTLGGGLQEFEVATTAAVLKHEVNMPVSSVVYLEFERAAQE